MTLQPDELISKLKRTLPHRPRKTLTLPEFRRAAVLVPLLRAPDGLELLFTVRSSTLPHHAGQISFPGGRLEVGESVSDAARRETVEEIGLNVPETLLLGTLSDLPSPARYVVTPVVGVLPWPQALTLQTTEVAEVFTVPLAELLAITPRQETRLLEGQRRVIYFYAHQSPTGERLIWGLTGSIVADFLSVVRALDG